MNGKKTSLRQGLAAFGASLLLTGALAPVTALAASPGATAYVDATPESDKAYDPSVDKADTDVYLYVTDGGASTVSVTAPVKIFLAVDIQEEDLQNDPTTNQPKYKSMKYDFVVPAAEKVKITNNSKRNAVRISDYRISGNTYGRTKNDDTNGFYNTAGTAQVADQQGNFWLQAVVSGAAPLSGETTAVTPTIDLAKEGPTAFTAGSSDAQRMTMAANPTGSAANTSLTLALSGEMYGPNKDTIGSGFGMTGGNQLNKITWSFEVLNV